MCDEHDEMAKDTRRTNITANITRRPVIGAVRGVDIAVKLSSRAQKSFIRRANRTVFFPRDTSRKVHLRYALVP